MQKIFQYNNTTVAYTRQGSGKAVVLLHGFGEDGTVWNAQADFLKYACELIVPDLPGSGHSGSMKQDWSVEDFANCIFALLLHENINSCILLGHSMGGYITLAFAEKYPQMLRGFGLLHSTAIADSSEKKQNRLRGIEIMEAYGAYHFLKTTIPNLFAPTYKTEFPERVNTLIERGRQFSKITLQQYYRAMINRPDRTHILQNNKLPVLFILGKEDIAAPLNDVLQQVYLPDIAYIHILENVAHMGMWEEEKKFNDYMLRFIQQTGNDLQV